MGVPDMEVPIEVCSPSKLGVESNKLRFRLIGSMANTVGDTIPVYLLDRTRLLGSAVYR